MSSNLSDFSLFGPPPFPPLSPPLPFAPPSPSPATAAAALQQCPICGRTQGPIDFIVHMMYDHPAFFAIWADYSRGNLFSSTTTPIDAFTAALQSDVLFDEDTGFDNDDADADAYDDAYDDADADQDADDDADPDAEDADDAETDAESDPPTPSYEELLLLCETIGDHPVGVSNVNAVAPIVSAPSDPTTRCTICLESMSDLTNIRKITRCRHEFCDPCLRRWFRDHHTCPVCKDDVPRSV